MSKKGEKSAQQTAPKIREVVPPPVFEASDWIKSCANDPIAQFKLYPVDFYNTLKQQDFSILDEFNGEPVDQQVGKIAAEFDQATAETLFSAPSEQVTQFRDYLRTYMTPKANAPIATNWPPLVPQVDEKLDAITVFLARIVRATKNPTLFLYWLSVEIFPTTFTRQTKFNALALCRCKEAKKKKKELWAVLDGESVFHLYSFEKNEPKEILKGNAVKTTIAADQLTVEIRGQDNKVISSFQPIDPQQVELWARAFDKDERPAIPFFCTSFSTPIIDQFYGAMQQVCSNSDAAVLRACISDGVIPASSNVALGLTKAFTDIFVYSQRPTVLANAIISSELSPFGLDIIEKFEGPMYTKHLFESFLVKFGTPYAQSFMARFISYIDSNASSLDSEKEEVVLFSALKYLLSSLPYVPSQVRFLFSILRAHLTARDNSLGAYLKVTSTIFREYIFAMLNDPGKIQNVSNQNAVTEYAKKLYVALSFGKLEKWAQRLEAHVFPKLRDFLIALGDIDEMPDFPPPNATDLARSLEVVMKALASCQEKFRPAYMSSIDPSNEQQRPSLLGANYSALIALFFKQSFDTLEVAEDVPEEGADAKKKHGSDSSSSSENGGGEKVKKHHHKLVKAELQPDASGVIRRIVRRDPNEVVDPSKPRKYYKRVVKHVPRE